MATATPPASAAKPATPITPVTAAVRDGLGNQLFIIMSALAHARHQGRRLLLPRRHLWLPRAYWDGQLAAAPSATAGCASTVFGQPNLLQPSILSAVRLMGDTPLSKMMHIS